MDVLACHRQKPVSKDALTVGEIGPMPASLQSSKSFEADVDLHRMPLTGPNLNALRRQPPRLEASLVVVANGLRKLLHTNRKRKKVVDVS